MSMYENDSNLSSNIEIVIDNADLIDLVYGEVLQDNGIDATSKEILKDCILSLGKYNPAFREIVYSVYQNKMFIRIIKENLK